METKGTLDTFERTITGQINTLTKRIVRLEGINGHLMMRLADQDTKIAKLTADLAEAKR
jgi:hypothetical protein